MIYNKTRDFIFKAPAPEKEKKQKKQIITLIRLMFIKKYMYNICETKDVDGIITEALSTVSDETEAEINRRALFSAADNKSQKDTIAAQTARKVSDALKAGHALGNTKTGETSGEPKANLKGRTLNGTLPRPSYTVQAEGTVVVDIWVDNYGNVQKAVAGGEGTTVSNKDLWLAARKAALGAHFNMSADAPALQKGTITYIFKLN